ncbi:MAG: hypothetical protein A2Z08_10765 [Deltaproteobacteria bacterium RBG_16_54_11]|nr:MAG: hypothetical protein A2Z08_10765 [Deltaproteobacteria bacterium RBG_16_54_11]
MTTIVCPIVFKDFKKNIKLSEQVVIRAVTKGEKEDISRGYRIGYKFVDEGPFRDKIQIESFTDPHGGGYLSEMSDNLKHFLAANHCVELTLPAPFLSRFHEEALKINLALKLFKLTSSGIFIWFNSDKHSEGRNDEYLNPFNGPFGYLTLGEADGNGLRNIYERIDFSDGHLSLMTFLFLRSLQSKGEHYDIRFLQLATILEMLFAKDSPDNLTYKLSIRSSKLLGQRFKEDGYLFFRKIKDIYKMRSKIVHSADYNKFDITMFCELAEIIRKCLNIYLENKDSFEPEELDKLILN